jgi:molybdenum cofactor cytidylyltransferase
MNPITGLLLAAGSSRRFGADKRWHRLADGTPMAVASARRLLAACPHSIAVVRADDTALAELLTQEGLQCVVAERAGEGMGYSLAAGVAATMDAVTSNAAKAVSGAAGADKNARDNATDDAAGNAADIAADIAANPAAGGWLVALADMPFIAPASYAAVLAALADGARIARPAAAVTRSLSPPNTATHCWR